MLILFFILSLTIIALWWANKYISLDTINQLDKKTWFLILSQSSILSLGIGWGSRKILIKFPETYHDFISGNISFNNSTKIPDFFQIYISIIVFIFVTLFIIKLIQTINDCCPDLKPDIFKLTIYSLIPSAILAGQSLRFNNTVHLIFISLSLIALALAILSLLTYLFTKSLLTTAQFRKLIPRLPLLLIFLTLSGFGIYIFISRTFILPTAVTILFSVPIAGIIFFLILKHKSLDTLVLKSQLGIPLAFFILTSPRVILQSNETTTLQYKPLLYLLVMAFVFISYFDLYRRFKTSQGISERQLSSEISPWVLVALLTYIQSRNLSWPYISMDEFHSGEFYLPWWSFQKFHLLPYLGYQPARGLINYVPGLFSWLFSDNTFAGISLVENQFILLYTLLSFFSLRSLVGNLFAFVAVASLFDFPGLAGGMVVTFSFLVILYKLTSEHQPIRFLWLWLGLSLFAALYAIAEGSLFIISTLPWAIYMVYQAFRRSKKRLGISIGVLILSSILIFAITDFGKVIFAAARYLVEQSGINEFANGIAFNASNLSLSDAVTSGYLWQIIRFSWLFLLIPILILLLKIKDLKSSFHNRATWAFVFSILILVIFMIPRAIGRIDPGLYSRPGLASVSFIICGLPLLTAPFIKDPIKKSWTLLSIAFAFGLLAQQETSLKESWYLQQQIIYEPVITVSGRSYGLDNIGNAAVVINPNQIQRQVNIKKVLDQILSPQETFFDVTNHTADYGYQGRPNPAADTAFYNTVSEAQQLRMISQLEEQRIPIALIESDNILHDGGTLPLRSFWIYKYLMKMYTSFQDEAGQIWMIRNDQIDRLNNTQFSVGDKKNQLTGLSNAFWQYNLQELPAAWGNSLNSLIKKLSKPVNLLDAPRLVGFNDFHRTGPMEWEITGSDPYLIFDIPQDIKGDILLIDTANKIVGDSIQVFWITDLIPNPSEENSYIFNAESSKYFVPLSAAPSWELSNSIKQIRIDFPALPGEKIILNNLTLFTREK